MERPRVGDPIGGGGEGKQLTSTISNRIIRKKFTTTGAEDRLRINKEELSTSGQKGWNS